MIQVSKNYQECDMEEMLVAYREEFENVSNSIAIGNVTVSRPHHKPQSVMKLKLSGRKTTASALFTKKDGEYGRSNGANLKKMTFQQNQEIIPNSRTC